MWQLSSTKANCVVHDKHLGIKVSASPIAVIRKIAQKTDSIDTLNSNANSLGKEKKKPSDSMTQAFRPQTDQYVKCGFMQDG